MVMCYGAPVIGKVGCFALFPPNLLLNTSKAHLVKHVKLGDLAEPKKASPERATR